MYPYNYNMQGYPADSIYTPAIDPNESDERIVGGIVAPLLLGGVAGYAIGQNNNSNNHPYMFYTYPYPYYNPYSYYPYNYYRK